MQTISRTGMELVVNNSWSGDTVSGRGVSRALQLHNNANRAPDIIAVYLGINDFRTKVTAEVFAESKIRLLGVEGPSVGPVDAPMAVHLCLLRKEIVLLEGLVLQQIPEGRYLLNAAPLNLKGFDGAPCRAWLMDME